MQWTNDGTTLSVGDVKIQLDNILNIEQRVVIPPKWSGVRGTYVILGIGGANAIIDIFNGHFNRLLRVFAEVIAAYVLLFLANSVWFVIVLLRSYLENCKVIAKCKNDKEIVLFSVYNRTERQKILGQLRNELAIGRGFAQPDLAITRPGDCSLETQSPLPSNVAVKKELNTPEGGSPMPRSSGHENTASRGELQEVFPNIGLFNRSWVRSLGVVVVGVVGIIGCGKVMQQEREQGIQEGRQQAAILQAEQDRKNWWINMGQAAISGAWDAIRKNTEER